MAETKKWATLISLRSSSSKPNELIRLTLVRAKLAESIAIKNNALNPNGYFLMGLLSTVDSLLDMPMDEALKLVPLDADITNALLHKTGTMGESLAALIQHENQFIWPKEYNYAGQYIEACHWADDAISGTL